MFQSIDFDQDPHYPKTAMEFYHNGMLSSTLEPWNKTHHVIKKASDSTFANAIKYKNSTIQPKSQPPQYKRSSKQLFQVSVSTLAFNPEQASFSIIRNRSTQKGQKVRRLYKSQVNKKEANNFFEEAESKQKGFRVKLNHMSLLKNRANQQNRLRQVLLRKDLECRPGKNACDLIQRRKSSFYAERKSLQNESFPSRDGCSMQKRSENWDGRGPRKAVFVGLQKFGAGRKPARS